MKSLIVERTCMWVSGLAAATSVAALCSMLACTKQQAVAGVNTAVQVAVDLCTEAPNLIPPNTPAGSIVALICPSVNAAAPGVTVFVDSVIWNLMKAEHAKRLREQGK
jgi:hypothetical protein